MKIIEKIVVVGSAAIFLAACSAGSSSNSTPVATWTWMGGTNSSNGYGNYGTKGSASINNIPGGRYIAVSWVDNNGKFWLFGGSGYAESGSSGNLNDMWQYDPVNGQWTWITGANSINNYGQYGVKGIAAPDNTPGARLGAVSWKDNNGNLWLFGGFGNGEAGVPGPLNDLWEFNPTNGEWTWVGGSKLPNADGVYGQKGIADSLNAPGARLGTVGWADSNGNLWMFGGSNDLATINDFNDLWKYDITSNQWTWVNGSESTNESGVYGIQQVAAITNHPGARIDSIAWMESNGTMWLFGGSGYNGIGTRGLLNDLWKYDAASNQWTWMSGSNMSNIYGIYGNIGFSTQNTIPGAREHRVPIAWIDNKGNLLMFGADGYANSTQGILNDFWSYNPGNNQWTWLGGSNESNSFGVYGSFGVAAAANIPGARMDATGWVDASGSLWLFGGSGNSVATNGYLNDLWKYTPVN